MKRAASQPAIGRQRAPQLDAMHRLDALHLPITKEAQHTLHVVGRPVRQPHDDRLLRFARRLILAAFSTQPARAEPVALGERGVEAAQAREARGMRDLCDRQRRVAEQLLGQQQAARGEVAVRRDAVRLLEHAAQVTVGDAQTRRDLGQQHDAARTDRLVDQTRRVLRERLR